MTNSVAPSCDTSANWIIVFDDACPVVNKLGWLVRQWDRDGIFRYIGRDNSTAEGQHLVGKLEETPWSLMLVSEDGQTWHGPEAIPFILKNLPSGRLAAVTYTVPGTMWLTRQLYYMVSRNRQIFNAETPKKTDCLSA